MQNPVLEIITAIVPFIIAAWAAWTAWRQKDRADQFKQELQLREIAQAEKRAEWEEADRQHKRRMEELTAVSVRQGNLAIRKASEAVQLAAASKDEIIASREERGKQMAEMKEGQQVVEAVVREGIAVSNNYNGKITSATEATHAVAQEMQKIREDLSKASDAAPPAAAAPQA